MNETAPANMSVSNMVTKANELALVHLKSGQVQNAFDVLKKTEYALV